MKKIALLLVIVMVVSSFCGCKSKEERQYRAAVKAAESAEKAADRAQKESDDLRDRLNSLQDAYDRLP